jgi:hypothetical protein
VPDIVSLRNIGAYLTVRSTALQATAVAGGTGNNTTSTGFTIDREGFGSGSLPDSALFAIMFQATLASGATLSQAFDVQHAPDAATWTDYSTTAETVVGTGPSGGGAVHGQTVLAVNLRGAARYIRLNSKPVHSATGTDTSISFAVAVLGGFDRLAAPI